MHTWKNNLALKDLSKLKAINFYGVDCRQFKLNDTVFEAIEDKDDGYRSLLDCVVVPPYFTVQLFYRSPIARVRIRKVDKARAGYPFKGFELLDVDLNHTWLRVGTTNWDDYYPVFTFEYTPPKITMADYVDKLANTQFREELRAAIKDDPF